MILNIFNSIWDKLNSFSNSAYKFVMDNFGNPFFWVIIFGLLLAVGLIGISKLADK